ncbi:hypothetical protein ACFW9D_16905, partial [Streptomyces sp. NPDC059524]|uniref:hypothetical protein n=1 Tax=Streptomyces sp. NPDC059524 TaxID=3346856 RepID=UPI0036CDDB5F
MSRRWRHLSAAALLTALTVVAGGAPAAARGGGAPPAPPRGGARARCHHLADPLDLAAQFRRVVREVLVALQ